MPPLQLLNILTRCCCIFPMLLTIFLNPWIFIAAYEYVPPMEYFPLFCGIFLNQLWNISQSTVEYFSPNCGIFLTLLWNISHSAVEYFSLNCGIFLTPLWNISHSSVEYVSLFCGIFLTLLWNISLSTMDYFPKPVDYVICISPLCWMFPQVE